MGPENLVYGSPVVLAGPTELDFVQINSLIRRGFRVIAADGGANALLEKAICPDAIIGDFDSLDRAACQDRDIRLIQLSEQDSTDFEKCLYSVTAPLYLALGFTGGRFDHTLAALHIMAKYHPAKRVILFSGRDISFVHRGALEIPGQIGQKLSIFPLVPISFQSSSGLEYALDGLTFEFGLHIGTSNRATGDIINIVPVRECLGTPYLVTLPNSSIEDILKPFLYNL